MPVNVNVMSTVHAIMHVKHILSASYQNWYILVTLHISFIVPVAYTSYAE